MNQYISIKARRPLRSRGFLRHWFLMTAGRICLWRQAESSPVKPCPEQFPNMIFLMIFGDGSFPIHMIFTWFSWSFLLNFKLQHAAALRLHAHWQHSCPEVPRAWAPWCDPTWPDRPTRPGRPTSHLGVTTLQRVDAMGRYIFFHTCWSALEVFESLKCCPSNISLACALDSFVFAAESDDSWVFKSFTVWLLISSTPYLCIPWFEVQSGTILSSYFQLAFELSAISQENYILLPHPQLGLLPSFDRFVANEVPSVAILPWPASGVKAVVFRWGQLFLPPFDHGGHTFKTYTFYIFLYAMVVCSQSQCLLQLEVELLVLISQGICLAFCATRSAKPLSIAISDSARETRSVGVEGK